MTRGGFDLPLSSRFFESSFVQPSVIGRCANAIALPSGDQLNSLKPPSGKSVSARGSPPRVEAIQICVFLSRVRANAICSPSGDQRGDESFTSPNVNCIAFPSCTSLIQRCVKYLFFSTFVLFTTYSTRAPSGDICASPTGLIAA